LNPSVVVILALAAPALAGCAGFGFGGEASPAKSGAAAPAQPIAPIAAVQAQPLPPAAPVAAAQSPAPTVPSGAALGGVLGGPIGASLTEDDREAAWKAQITALDSGQRRSWRGAHGVFGFVEPGSETGGGCRAFSQTIYVSGRPNRGQGVACKQAGGTWRMTS
jgi:surface antigen